MAWTLDDAARTVTARREAFLYDPGDVYEEGAHCATEPVPHAAELSRKLRGRFTWLRSIESTHGGRCVPFGGHGRTDLHSVGRALDVMIPLAHRGADGDRVANWLVANADGLGIQQVIWDNRYWRGANDAPHRFGTYTPPAGHPSNETWRHENHVHVEVTRDPGPAFRDSGAFTPPPPSAPASSSRSSSFVFELLLFILPLLAGRRR